MPDQAPATFGEQLSWEPEFPKIRPARLIASWLVSALALLVAAALVPGAEIKRFWGALLVALIVAVLNAIVPPLIAALRLPFTLVAGFLLVLAADAAILLAADSSPKGRSSSTGSLTRCSWRSSRPQLASCFR